jgi:hypothetical protein
VVDADHFTPVNLHAMTFYYMFEAQELTPTHAVNLAFVFDLP